MTWGKIDDHFDDDPRFMVASTTALGIFFRTLPRCLRKDDNLIPWAIANGYPEAHDVFMAGLWETDTLGYRVFPDLWEAIRMPEEKRQEISEKRAEAGKRGAAARWNGKGMAKPKQSHGINAPVPVPVPLKSPKGDSISRRVFEAWQEATGHRQAKLTEPRFRLIAQRIREGFDEGELMDAARGVGIDPWPERVRFNSFEQTFRDAARVERFRDFVRVGVPETAPALRLNRIDAEILQIGVFGDHPA
jgi:hypothetical protein